MQEPEEEETFQVDKVFATHCLGSSTCFISVTARLKCSVLLRFIFRKVLLVQATEQKKRILPF